MNKNEIKFIDLFAGIGGFHTALNKYGKEKGINTNCVFVSEIDNQAIETYVNNYNIKKESIIDIRKLDENSSQVPEHDILFAGFPCQTFSNAGNKLGFLDEVRGTLFFEIAKILKNKKPKFILLENVKHLTKHDNGKTWKIICETLENLGYLIPKEPLILSPEEFGIPQDRKRVFIPGVRKDLTNDNELKLDFEKYKNSKLINNKNSYEIQEYIINNFLEKNVSERFLLKNDYNGKYLISVLNAWDEFIKNVQAPKGRTMPVIWLDEFGKNYDTSNLSEWRKKYINDMRNLYKENKNYIDDWMIKHKVSEWKVREKKFEWQVGKDEKEIRNSFIQLRQSGIRCKRPTKFPTLVAMVQVPIIFDKNINEWRYLSTRENANLQSFPSDFKLYDELTTENKDFYSYKQFGNSVNVKVIYLIIKELLENYK